MSEFPCAHCRGASTHGPLCITRLVAQLSKTSSQRGLSDGRPPDRTLGLPASTPRVVTSPILQRGEVASLDGALFEDGKARVIVSANLTSAELEAIDTAIEQMDAAVVRIQQQMQTVTALMNRAREATLAWAARPHPDPTQKARP